MNPLINSLAVGAADAPAIKPAVELGTPLLLTIAVAGVALLLLMMTDAGFWVVARYYGLTVSDGLKTWTVLTTILGVAGFLLSLVAWILVGGLAH